MALLKVKRCEWCGHKLNESGECTNQECVSHEYEEVVTLIEEIKAV